MEENDNSGASAVDGPNPGGNGDDTVDLSAVLPGGEPAAPAASGGGEGGEDDPLAGVLPNGREQGDPPAPEDGKEGGKGEPPPEDKPLDITIPEGVERDDEMLTGFLEVAKESGMGQEKAQKLFDLHLASQKRMVERYEEGFRANVAKIDADFAKQCRTDPEFGGKHFEASRNYAQAAIRRFIPDPKEQREFARFYRDANLQNSPHLFRFFARIGKMTAEAGPPRDEMPHVDKGQGPEDLLFPHLPSARKA